MSRRVASAAAPNVKRCAVYTRKSTSAGLEQEFNSLHAQREACTAYIGRQPGWTLVTDQYDDGGFTGANIERPAFQRLMNDVEAGRIDIIVVYKVDRLSRSLLDFAKVMERLNAVDASFVSVTQNFSTADAMGRLTLNMLMSFAEFEREMIAERTRDKIAASRRKGKWTGGSIPFGYAVKDKKLVVNDSEAAIVREAFRLYLQQGQMASLARDLNQRALLPRRSALSSPDKALVWTKDSIARIIGNPLYAGYITDGNERFPGEHEALIDSDTWNGSQQLVKERARTLRAHVVNPEYLLAGLLRCGTCNGAMSPNSTRKDRRIHRYYRCTNRDKHGRSTCSAAPMAAGAIESYVVSQIQDVFKNEAFVQGTYGACAALVQQRLALLRTQKQSLASRVGEASARAGKLVDEWVDAEGDIRDLLGKRVSAARAEVALLEAGLAEVRRQYSALDSRRIDIEWVSRAISNLETVWDVMTPSNRGRLLRALIDRVVVNEPTGKIDIHLAHLDETASTSSQAEAS